MPTLDPVTLGELVDLMSPMMKHEDDRRALLWLAFPNAPFLKNINFSGPPESFILNTIRLLTNIGEFTPGRKAIDVLLEIIRDRLPEEDKKRVEGIKSLISTSILLEPRSIVLEHRFIKRIRIFISSPGDVADERAIAFRVIDQLQYDPFIRGQVVFEIVAWDRPNANIPMLAALNPQEAINQGLPRPADCNIVIVIFWARMGTPMPPEYIKNDGTPYLSGTEWEFDNAIQSSKKTGVPFVLVYRRMEEFTIKVNDKDFMGKYEQWQRVNTFFEKFINQDSSISQGYNTYNTPAEFQSKLEFHLREMIRRLLIAESELPEIEVELQDINNSSMYLQVRSEIVAWKGSPFPGLRAFESRDAPVFYGRGPETDGLIAKLSGGNCGFVAVVGASGSGKSSLVSAGLIPRLGDNAIDGSKDWIIIRFTPDELGAGDPFLSLAVALMRELKITTPRLPKELREKPSVIGDICREALSNKPKWTKLVVFIDQFEELFTLVSPEYRGQFVELLTNIAVVPEIITIATLRADFYASCVDWPKLVQLLRVGSYPLAAPKPIALYHMITRPAARAGLQLESGLVENILDDMGEEPGMLALMAYTLNELYRVCETENQITLAAYNELGGVKGAIGTRAEAIFLNLEKDAQAAWQRVFRKLVSVSDEGAVTRQRVPIKNIIDLDPSAEQFVNVFTNARLLVQNIGEDDQPIIEVAHEALFSGWPMLHDWIQAIKDDLRLLRQVNQASDEWLRQNKNKAFLWPHERLKYVYQMIDRLGINLEKDIVEYVKEFIRPESERLLEEINSLSTSHLRRATISDRLAEIGDSRPGIGIRPDGLPDIIWCKCSGGNVKLEGGTEIYPVEKFYISKYPITYIQYLSFIKADDGFYNVDWWQGIPMPSDAPQQYRQLDNHPVESVSWYDAIAFCRWLSSKFGYDIILPTECEWQQAASGGKPVNIYPWGGDWDSNRTNTSESGLSRTIAVGMYPQGASQFGAYDMAGNIWEWCLNVSDEPRNIIIEERVKRAVRGGCWFHDGRVVRTAFRNTDWDYTHPRSHLRGFRISTKNPITSKD